jgi:long-chain acyl-CoA synthetase
MADYPPTIAHALLRTVERIPDQVAVRTATDDISWTWRQLFDHVCEFALGLRELGVRPGDRVGLLLSNRPEFHVTDLATILLGGIPFSIYYTYAPEQIEFVMGDAEASVLITEQGALERALLTRKNLPELREVILVDGAAPEGVRLVQDVVALGRDSTLDVQPELDGLEPESVATIIYTSGTTGDPKGVHITHRNVTASALATEGRVAWPEDARVISWLPAAHIAERAAHYYLPVIFGAQITCCPDPRLVAQYLPAVQPTWFFAVPRVWEKLKAALESSLPADAMRAVDAAVRKVRLEQNGQPVPEELARAVADADMLFAELRQKLGLAAAGTVNAGAAPTPPEVLEFFHAIGVPVSELWGMSESTGCGCSNPPELIKIGTVGPPAPGIELRLAPDGEILLRGETVTPGYRNQPEQTAEAIVDGWLHTGDIGTLDADGYLTIIDRKKELIINAMGKNMSPALIESRLKAASPLIGQACCIGDTRPYNTALIVLDPDAAPVWAAHQGIDDSDLGTLAADHRVRAAIERGIDAANSRLSRVEQIKKFTIIHGDWLPAGDELTPTMKLKRRTISQKYRDLIEAMYA